MLTIRRLFTTPHSARKWRHIGRSQRRSGKRDPPQALTPRGKSRSPRRRRSPRTKAKAAGTSGNQRAEIRGRRSDSGRGQALQLGERSKDRISRRARPVPRLLLDLKLTSGVESRRSVSKLITRSRFTVHQVYIYRSSFVAPVNRREGLCVTRWCCSPSQITTGTI
jgi:hypothetical protein